MIERYFYTLFSYFNAKKSLAIAFFAILTLLLGYLAAQIKFEEDITKFIPTEFKNEDAQKVLKTVNYADKIVVLLSKDSRSSTDQLTDFAAEFVDSLDSNFNHWIASVQGKVEENDLMKTLDFVYNNLPLFLSPEDYDRIEQKIQKDSIAATILAGYKTLLSPSGIATKNMLLKDPLGFSYLALKRFQELTFGGAFTLHNGFILSGNKNHILLFINPLVASSETAENALFVAALKETSQHLMEKYQAKLTCEFYGGAVIAVENAQQIKRDIQLTVGITLTLLLILLIFFYKKIALPIILLTPTVLGGLLAVAALFLIRGEISAISLGIGSVLLGVTLDYSLHILTHIRNHGSIEQVYKNLTRPILMSSLTTMCAFLCLLFLKSQALQDLGIFAAISVLSAAVFALLCIPLLYQSNIKKEGQTTFIDRMASIRFEKNKYAILVIFAFIVLSFWTYDQVTFNKDLNNLNFKSDAILATEGTLDTLTNMNEKSLYLVAYHNDLEIALQANDSLYQVLNSLKKEQKIINFSSAATFYPSQKKQLEQIAKWHSFWNTEKQKSIHKLLIESSAVYGFKENAFASFYQLLNKDFEILAAKDFEQLTSFSVQDYVSSKEGFATVSTLVKVAPTHISEIRSLFKQSKNVLLIDRQNMNETFLSNLKTDFNRLIIYSLVVVLLLLALFYRSLSLTLITSIPIFLTWWITLGIIGLFGIEFNIFNIIISTFIFGLGIDYSIFVTNGLLAAYRFGTNALKTNKTSVLLSVITTLLGLGVLIFAKHPALYSIALISIIGINTAYLVAFIIQPLLFQLFIGKNKRPTTLLELFHAVLSFSYFGLGGLLLSLYSITLHNILPFSKKKKMKWFHVIVSKFMGIILRSNPFLSNKIINPHQEDFKKQGILIANHTSFLDILSIGKLDPKIIFLVNDWVYNSPVFGKAVQKAGFYPVSSGVEGAVSHLQAKLNQGYSLMIFPEGTRSRNHTIRRFHKGVVYLAESLQLDIVPIVIHGNSKSLGKGSFIIKRGVSTLKMLPRIAVQDLEGKTLAKKTKSLRTYFKKEYDSLRKDLEATTYFHGVLLEHFRYKGAQLYKLVKDDLKTFHQTYAELSATLGNATTFTSITKGPGHLTFLLTLDQIDRVSYTFIAHKEYRELFQHNYLCLSHKKTTVVNSFEDALAQKTEVLLLDNTLNETQLKHCFNSDYQTIILLKAACTNLDTALVPGHFVAKKQHKEYVLYTNTKQ